MAVDKLITEIIKKKAPCIVGIDPEWSKIPQCYKSGVIKTEGILNWAKDVIDTVADIVPAVKPQMAFFEAFGAEGIRVFEKISAYAHEKDLLVVDDSKRGDIGNTAKAYAFAHLAKESNIDADFLTVSPFLGTDSLLPFADTAREYGKGLFILVKTSNPSSKEISEAVNAKGDRIAEWLADTVSEMGKDAIGKYGYSSIGAVVGATFPEEAKRLRERMKKSVFLVPGYGAQGGSARDIVSCFNEDGLGAIVNSSRGILYKYLDRKECHNTRKMYLETVRNAAIDMQKAIYRELKTAYPDMRY